MFNFLSTAFAAWHEVAHISEWTGLSLGVLAALAGLVYLDSALLKPAIGLAVAIVIGYCTLIYGYHQGASDIRGQWTAANTQAAKAAQQRDVDAQKAAEAQYGPIIEAREKMIAELDDEVDDYDQQLAKANDPCLLGGDPLWLRNGKPVPHVKSSPSQSGSAPNLRANPKVGPAAAGNGKK